MKFTFTYTGIRVRNLDTSLEFYTKVLGMELLERIQAPETKGEFAELVSEDSENVLEINWYSEDSPVAGEYREGEELDHLAFEVNDLDAALAYLDQRGYPRVMGPLESKGARWVYVKDPDDIWIELFQTKRQQSGTP
ncbi:MAG: VOC family protein [Thermoplasmata archaeon]